jgi:hypothetical protein
LLVAPAVRALEHGHGDRRRRSTTNFDSAVAAAAVSSSFDVLRRGARAGEERAVAHRLYAQVRVAI